MKLSVVLSVYNGEKYIREQLDSLRIQTRPADEVLIFDDGSTDASVTCIIDYIERYQLRNWKLIQNKTNFGWRKSFMKGMQQSIGDLIFPCDQDDIWMPEKLEKMEQVMKENTEIRLLVSPYKEFYADGSEKISMYSEDHEAGEVYQWHIPENLLNVPFPGCVYAIRRSFFELCNQYWLESCPHDALFWRSAELLSCAWVYNEPLINWRRHECSAWNQESSKKTLSSEKYWRKAEQKELEMLCTFAANEGKESKNRLEKIVQRNLDWCVTRQKFYETKNPVAGLKLIKYLTLYYNYKAYLKDWILTYTGK